MKKQDLIKLNKDELQTKLTDGQEALVNLRFQKALQQLEHPQKIKLIKSAKIALAPALNVIYSSKFLNGSNSSFNIVFNIFCYRI